MLCVGFLWLRRAGPTLRCGAWASHCGVFSCGARVLGTRASVVARELSSCGSQALERRLSSCGARALLLCGMWDLLGPGLEPVSPALAGRFLTTVPPGKPIYSFKIWLLYLTCLTFCCFPFAFRVRLQLQMNYLFFHLPCCHTLLP